MAFGGGRSVLSATLQLAALVGAACVALATSAGEANDEESVPGGGPPGEETSMGGDDEVDFTEVTEPTTIVTGGDDFVLTADGETILTLVSQWHGGGGQATELQSRKLVAIEARTGDRVAELDVRDAGAFGVVLLADPHQLVLVRRDDAGLITGLEGIQLPSMTVQWTHQPRIPANTVRMSPSGRYAAFWKAARLGWVAWDLQLSVNELRVSVEEIAPGNAWTEYSTPTGVAEVIAAPDSSAFFIALSTRDYDSDPPRYWMDVMRVELTPSLTTTTRTLQRAGHASDSEIIGGSNLRLSPDGQQLVFSGCSFTTGTCNARWFLLDADTLQPDGDLRAAGGAAFASGRNLAVGWDGLSSDEGKIWVTTCIFSSDPADSVDHWLLTVDRDTLDATPYDLPKLAPYYFATRDGAFIVTSVENCDDEELWAINLETQEASPIRYADHSLHQFTVMEDHRTVYSVDLGVLERIDLTTLESTPGSFTRWVSRINRLPGSRYLVLAGPELLVFYLWDTHLDSTVWQLDLGGGAQGAQPPSPPPPYAAPGSSEPASPPHRWSVPMPRAARQLVPHAPLAPPRSPRLQRPRRPGGAAGLELRF